jgi:hypothetical protein
MRELCEGLRYLGGQVRRCSQNGVFLTTWLSDARMLHGSAQGTYEKKECAK